MGLSLTQVRRQVKQFSYHGLAPCATRLSGCTGNHGTCPMPAARQESLAEKLGEVIKGIAIDKGSLDWLIQALRERHRDGKSYHDGMIDSLQAQYRSRVGIELGVQGHAQSKGCGGVENRLRSPSLLLGCRLIGPADHGNMPGREPQSVSRALRRQHSNQPHGTSSDRCFDSSCDLTVRPGMWRKIMTILTIKTATASDADPAIAVVVLAFSSDPVARWAYPDPQ